MRSQLSLSSALCVSLLTTASLLASCSSDDAGQDGTGASGGTGGSGAGSTAKGGSGGTTAGSSGATAGGTGGGTGGTGTAGSKATGGNAGTMATGGASAGGTGGSTGGTSGGGTGGSTGGATTGGSAGAGGTGGALGGAGAGGAAGTGGGSGGTGGGSGEFELTSPAFENVEGCSAENPGPCEAFPTENMQYMSSPNESPELNWTNPPAGTMSFAVVLHDLTFPNIHWALWNIAGSATGIPANIEKVAMPAMPAGTQQVNFQRQPGYFGPGSSCNAYQFIVYALATNSFMPAQTMTAANVKTALDELEDDVLLGTATLTGRANWMNMCDP